MVADTLPAVSVCDVPAVYTSFYAAAGLIVKTVVAGVRVPDDVVNAGLLTVVSL